MLERELSHFLLSVVLLLSAAILSGRIFSAFKMPAVIGEILSGFILGPSFLGSFSPEMFGYLFQNFPGQDKLLSVFYWLGLILLMFSAGFGLPRKFERGDAFLVLTLFTGGLLIPLMFGYQYSHYMTNNMGSNDISFSLVIAVAASVTSIPVLSRIFLDFEIIESQFAKSILTAAALQDLILWVILSVALAIQSNQVIEDSNIFSSLQLVANLSLFTLGVICITQLISKLQERFFYQNPSEASLISLILLVCLLLVSISAFLEVNVVFGALLSGIVVGYFSDSRMTVAVQSVKSLSLGFFTPLYFSLVGLQINIPHNFNIKLLLELLLLTTLVKVASVSIVARLSLQSWRKAFNYGMAMNARGGPGIVLASLAYGSKIIDQELFVVLVLISLITSLISSLWIRKRLGEIKK